MIDADAFASSNLRSRPHITGYVYDVERRVGGGCSEKGRGKLWKKAIRGNEVESVSFSGG